MEDFIKLSAPSTREFWKVPILFEDAELLALEKPAGLSAGPDRWHPERPSVLNLLHGEVARGAPSVRERGWSYLALAQRLDSGASGILLLAKSKPALSSLASQFWSETAVKEYAVLVHGRPPKGSFQAEGKLAPDPERPGRMRIDAEGKKSITRFELVEGFRGYSQLRAWPVTARTHQIRVHLKSLKLPVVGDKEYGGRLLYLSQLKRGYRFKKDQEERALVGRVALHAERLAFQHPSTGGLVEIRAPWPKDLKAAVRYLQRFAGGIGPGDTDTIG